MQPDTCRLYPARQYRERRCFRHLCRLESTDRTNKSVTALSDARLVCLHRYHPENLCPFLLAAVFPDNYKLLLTNPVGSTELELIVKDGQTQLTDNKGQKYYSDDPDSMIYQLTGMTIPMENLRQWIVGLPGDAQSYAISNQYHLKALSWAQGMEKWKVTYQSYDEKVSPQLPNRLDIEQGDNRIKLKMDSWTLN